MESWGERRYVGLLCGLIGVAALTRFALVIDAPRSFGYVWDLYHEGVILTWQQGRLPLPNACWECYNPPLYFAVGAPLYGLGTALAGGDAAAGLRLLSLLSMLCAGVVVYYCDRTLRLFRAPRGALLLGTALALVFPCLFIASYGAENDILLAALMSAFFYRLCRYHLHPARSSPRDAAVMGFLAGLCALTKYSGLLALIAAGAVMSPRLLAGRRRAARDLLIFFAVAIATGGWPYARNMRAAGRPLLSPPGYSNTGAAGARELLRETKRYDFGPPKIAEVVDLFHEDRAGELNDLPVYDGVFTTLNALAWTDMSFFSVPSRHGWKLPPHYDDGGGKIELVAQTPADQASVPPYPARRVRLRLVALVLRLGLFPTALALFGFAATFRRRALRPVHAFTVLSLAAYAWWFLAQPGWALKTKYILFLLPAYAVYALAGLSFARRLDRRIGWAAAACLIATLVVSEAYLWMFALG